MRNSMYSATPATSPLLSNQIRATPTMYLSDNNFPQNLIHRRPSSTNHNNIWKRDPLLQNNRPHYPLHAIPRGGNTTPPPGFLRRTFPSFPWSNLPNLLTYVRCVAIPLLVVIYYSTLPAFSSNRPLLLSSLFAVASFTDWLDGFLARRWNVTSPFGAFLDPVADKLMVSTALILLAGTYGKIVAIPTAIILAREIAVSALREWMAQRGLRDSVKVGMQGKVKTAATMVALTVLLAAGEGTKGLLYQIGMAGLYFSALVTVTSGSVYFVAARPVLMGEDLGGTTEDQVDTPPSTSTEPIIEQVTEDVDENVDKES